MKKHNSILLIILLVFSIKGFSQETLTKEQAVTLVLENNYGVKIAKNAVTVAENNTDILNTGFLPTVTGSAGATYNLDNSEV